MAYRTDVNARDKGGAILAVAAVHAALLFALLNLSGTIELADPQSALKIINLSTNPPPPPPAVAMPQPKPKEKEGGAAPKNIRSQATPVVAPRPRLETPPVQKKRREHHAAPGNGTHAGRLQSWRSRDRARAVRERHGQRQRRQWTGRRR